MQKLTLSLALILVLGCVSAIDVNSKSWSTQPKVVAYNGTNDTVFLTLQNALVSSSANNTISFMNVKDDTVSPVPVTYRTFRAKDLGLNGNDTVVTVNSPTDKVAVAIADFAVSAAATNTKPQQVMITSAPYNGGAAIHTNVTKNTNNDTVYTVYSIFVHQGRYYVVYGNSTSNLNISGIDANGANVNTVVLTNNATTTAANVKVDCTGVSSQQSAYCLFIYQNGSTNTGLWGAVVGLKGDNNKAPTANAVNANVIPDTIKAFNAGKQYGALYLTGGAWFFNNNKNTTVAPFPAPVAGATFDGQSSYPYKDSYATFWTLPISAGSNLNNYTVQYIGSDSKFTNGSVVSNVVNTIFTQFKDGSLYAAPQNTTHIYLGQVWGSTGMSASALQSVFAIVLSAIAALFLF